MNLGKTNHSDANFVSAMLNPAPGIVTALSSVLDAKKNLIFFTDL
jgi:hypothetical protein